MEFRPILALALAAVVVSGFALLTSLIRPEDSPLSDENQSSVGAMREDIYNALQDVAYFTVFGQQDGTSSRETAYVVEGMLRLATALEMLALRDGLDSQEFDAPRNLRRAAHELRESAVRESSGIVREAFTNAADATAELQRRSYPHLAPAAATLNDVAARVRSDRRLADQNDAIAAYFDAVSDALIPMILLRR